MPLTIAQYRDRIALMLDDTSLTRYTANQLDMAVRQALTEFDAHLPVKRTYIIDSTGTRAITLPADFAALNVRSVELDTTTDPIPLKFRADYTDEGWEITTIDQVIPLGNTITITYSAQNTIDGLDSAAGTTIPLAHTETIAIGATGFAARSRAVSRAESINLQPSVQKQLSDMANSYIMSFYQRLAQNRESIPAANWDMPEGTF